MSEFVRVSAGAASTTGIARAEGIPRATGSAALAWGRYNVMSSSPGQHAKNHRVQVDHQLEYVIYTSPNKHAQSKHKVLDWI